MLFALPEQRGKHRLGNVHSAVPPHQVDSTLYSSTGDLSKTKATAQTWSTADLLIQTYTYKEYTLAKMQCLNLHYWYPMWLQVQFLKVPLLIQLPANAPGKVAGGGSSP